MGEPWVSQAPEVPLCISRVMLQQSPGQNTAQIRKIEAFYQNPACAQGWLPKPSSQLETKDGQMGKDLGWLRSGTEMRKKP